MTQFFLLVKTIYGVTKEVLFYVVVDIKFILILQV
jgi:hypothetical protein